MTAAQVRVTGDASGNLFLTDGIAGDQIKIDRLLSGSAYGLQAVRFADGSSWTRAQLVLQETTGTAPPIRSTGRLAPIFSTARAATTSPRAMAATTPSFTIRLRSA